MSLTSIRQAIDDILSAVPGVNNVYQFRRWATERNKQLSFFKVPIPGQDKFTYEGWMITRSSVNTQFTKYQKKWRCHIFTIEGFMQLNDEDENSLLFQNILELIEQAFDNNQTLNDTCETIYPDWGTMSGVPGFQINSVKESEIGGKLCHFADCRLCAVEKYD